MLVAWALGSWNTEATSAVQAALKMIKGEPVEAEVWVPFQLIKPEQLAVFEQRYK
jgi:inositol transport system substrate-binding protein